MNGWTDGFPVVPETDRAIARFLDAAALDAKAEVTPGVAAREAAVQAIRAGALPEYMPVIVAALEAVLDPAFSAQHLASRLSTWPAFVVNGPVVEKLGLYSGIYVMASARRANATIGRAISLALANTRPELAGRDSAVLGNASRMAGMVIAEKEDTPWTPLHAMLGQPREASSVTAFPTALGSPLQILPLGTRYTSAPPIAALIADHCSQGGMVPGTQMLLVSPNAQRAFLADNWSKEDLRAHLQKNARVSVAQLKRLRRWKPAAGERADARGSAPIVDGDEERWFRLGDPALWPNLHALNGEAAVPSPAFDVLPVVAGSEVAHLYMYLFHPYPSASARPVTKEVKLP